MKLKKVWIALMGIAMLFFVVACGNDEETAGANEEGEEQAYPTDDVEIITPFGAGGTMDLAAHAMTKEFKSITGQALVVKNMPGGAGVPPTMELIKADPDGYTLAMLPSGQLSLRPLLQKVEYSYPDDFTTILGVGDFQMHPVVKGDAPYDTMAEMIDYLKENNEEARVGTPGVNTFSHLFAEQLHQEAGFNYRHLPFEGGKKVVSAILGGHIEMGVINVSDVYQQVENGELKILGFPSAERFENFPDVPTLKEQGIDIVGGPTFGIYGPADMPEDVKNKLKDIFLKTMESKDFVQFAENNNILVTKTEAEEMKDQITTNQDNLTNLIDQMEE
ncbi:tripartite tricarboxylate transporter substrate binding protein [Paraliobacillus salinarum]|uniref:tripartite tricarboxylate transporter substrate binding protein n=1 Tax=Paraliobacillus salinarum TaxID=1158996 RepID=UPI0015F47D63|nr:tripartite tricarboxylate transporter substrate binding protein [Paraliobacillus salinarum]